MSVVVVFELFGERVSHKYIGRVNIHRKIFITKYYSSLELDQLATIVLRKCKPLKNRCVLKL